jgi:glycosyltransferase involved in cell wall biosynthesis
MPVPIAIDYRPALLSRAGIGRVVHLFATSLAAAKVASSPPTRARLHRWPLPARALGLLARLGCGADTLAGGARVFHWTDYVHPPLARARAVLTVHDVAFARDPSWHGPAAATLLARTRAAAAAAAAIVVPSASTAADLRRFVPHTAPVHVIPFGADHVPQAPPPPPPLSRRYALCLGTLEPRKNHRALLAAWRGLAAHRPHLVVLGGIGWQCDAIVADVQQAVAAGLATWLPNVADAALWSWLAHAELLLYPSQWEGFGFPPLEAMQLGVPVLAHDCAPLRELGDGVFLFVDATDPAALQQGIARALDDDAWRATARTAGRRRATDFRWARCAAAHAAVYHEVGA